MSKASARCRKCGNTPIVEEEHEDHSSIHTVVDVSQPTKTQTDVRAPAITPDVRASAITPDNVPIMAITDSSSAAILVIEDDNLNEDGGARMQLKQKECMYSLENDIQALQITSNEVETEVTILPWKWTPSLSTCKPLRSCRQILYNK